MVNIHNVHERCVLDSVSMYGKRKKNLRNEPTEQLLNLRNSCTSFIAYQPPYNNSSGFNQWNDISVYNEELGIDCRIEVKSLQSESSLNQTILSHIMEARNIPEKELILVLFGVGYDSNIIRKAHRLITELRVNVRIFLNQNELQQYLSA